MSEMFKKLEELKKRDKELEVKEKKLKIEQPIKPRKRRTNPKPTDSPKLYEEMIKIQKEQTELLKKIANSLRNPPAERASIDIEAIENIIEEKISSIKVPTFEYKHVEETTEVKNLIINFIKGKMPDDKLPSGRNHRTFRIGNFIKRMQDEWKIIIDRELVETTKIEMEKDGEILPTGAAGKNTRYVLKEFIGEYLSKITKKDRDILNWLNYNSRFMNKVFTKTFYSKNNPVRPSDHDWRSANRKLKVLMRKKWIEFVPNSHPKEFLVNQDLVQGIITKII